MTVGRIVLTGIKLFLIIVVTSYFIFLIPELRYDFGPKEPIKIESLEQLEAARTRVQQSLAAPIEFSWPDHRRDDRWRASPAGRPAQRIALEPPSPRHRADRARRRAELLEEREIPHSWRPVEGGGHSWGAGFTQAALAHSLTFVAQQFAQKQAAEGLKGLLGPDKREDGSGVDKRD